jgi:WD40 repeat protein
VLDTQKALDNSDQAVIKVLMGFDNFIDGAAFSPDGALLAASDDNGTVIVWNTATWQPITTLHIPPASQGFGEFQAYVFRPSFTADGSKLIVGGYNHILIWDTYTHQPYMPLISEIGYFNNVAINPADTQMVVAFLNGMVGVQSLVPGDWQAQACSIAHRNLTTSEWAEQIGTGTDLPYQKICPDVP